MNGRAQRWEWHGRPPPSRQTQEPENVETTETWCNELFPQPHNALQMGVVDYPVHGGSTLFSRSLAVTNIRVLAPHIQSIVTGMEVPSEESELVVAIAKAVTEIEHRAYTTGMPIQPTFTPPRTEQLPFKIAFAPLRKRYSWESNRLAPIEDRYSTPKGIRSGRLHVIQTRPDQHKQSEGVKEQQASIQQQLL